MSLLTIAIPTFNRSNILRFSIPSILRQIRGYDIDLLISDNRSTDDTCDLVYNYMSSFEQVHLTINNKEQTADCNILNCLNEAKGDYIWLMGDDDLILEGSIPSVLRCLKSEPSLIHVNTCGILSKDKRVYSTRRYLNQGALYYSDANAFVKKIGIYITFLSGLIFRKRSLVELDKNLISTFVGTSFLQSHIAFCLLKNGSAMVDTTACVASTPNRSVNYDPFKVWIIEFYNLFYSSAIRCGISADTIDSVLYDSFKYEILCLLCKYFYTSSNELNYATIDLSQKILNRYPDVLDNFKLMLRTEHQLLPILRLLFRVRRDFYNLKRKYAK